MRASSPTADATLDAALDGSDDVEPCTVITKIGTGSALAVLDPKHAASATTYATSRPIVRASVAEGDES